MMTTVGECSVSEPNANLAARFTRDVEPLFAVLSRGARRLTRSDADAEDLLQDTLLHAFAGFRTFQEGTNLKAWLFRILYNRWVTAYRSKQTRPAEVSLDKITERDLAGWAARLPAGQRSAESAVLDSLPESEIKVAMDTLPARFRIALYLVDVEGYTFATTAAMLGPDAGPQGGTTSRPRWFMSTN
jgi:RNA polymerase sigma factor (sigma-70 family)